MNRIIGLLFISVVLLSSCTISENSIKEENDSSSSLSTNNDDQSKDVVETTITTTTVAIETTARTEKRIEHYCDAEGCTKEGKNEYIGFSGQKEYYCDAHLKEINDFYAKMEEDVGKGPYSKHKCEMCDKEGTYSIIGISGEIEYYCTEHYNDLVEMLKSFDK